MPKTCYTKRRFAQKAVRKSRKRFEDEARTSYGLQLHPNFIPGLVAKNNRRMRKWYSRRRARADNGRQHVIRLTQEEMTRRYEKDMHEPWSSLKKANRESEEADLARTIIDGMLHSPPGSKTESSAFKIVKTDLEKVVFGLMDIKWDCASSSMREKDDAGAVLRLIEREPVTLSVMPAADKYMAAHCHTYLAK